MKRFVAFFFLFAAYGILLAHSFIPHQHRDEAAHEHAGTGHQHLDPDHHTHDENGDPIEDPFAFIIHSEDGFSFLNPDSRNTVVKQVLGLVEFGELTAETPLRIRALDHCIWIDPPYKPPLFLSSALRAPPLYFS
ncbi:MAG TPA: hypothetical protein DIW47_04615 [Bacteroidetes bacterium]|nr:hypothetical protein [Bacteroidota bacterium]